MVHDPVAPGHSIGGAWIATPDGTLVADGVAGLADYPAPSPLRSLDRRPVAQHDLDLLSDIPVGQEIHAGATSVNMKRQRELVADPELLPQPLDWYERKSPWGPPVACPSVAVDLLWGPFEKALRPHVKPAVGLYGAIEVHHRNGPLLSGCEYELTGVVTDLSASPKTEIFWAETTASRDGTPIASLIMMIRLLK